MSIQEDNHPELVLIYAGWIRKHKSWLWSWLQNTHQLDDFKQDLWVALDEAIRSLDPNKASLNTHAWWKFTSVSSKYRRARSKAGRMPPTPDEPKDWPDAGTKSPAELAAVAEVMQECPEDIETFAKEKRWLLKRWLLKQYAEGKTNQIIPSLFGFAESLPIDSDQVESTFARRAWWRLMSL